MLTFILFTFKVTVLPPGEWDPSIRIEPPDAIPEQGKRLESAKSGGNGDDEEHDPAGDREEQLQKTGRLEESYDRKYYKLTEGMGFDQLSEFPLTHRCASYTHKK